MKRTLTDFYTRLTFPEWTVPLAFLAVLIAGFGLLIPWLGYYMDDWHYVYYAYVRGISSLWELLFYDSRPYAAWLYVLGFKLLGFRPLNWHVTSLLLRWLTTLLLWRTMQSIWPKHRPQAIMAALLFAVYPFFLLQPLAVAYSLHWTGFALFALSLLLMLRSFEKGKIWWLALTVLAMAAEATHLFTSEYFSGLELLRPILLWLIISRTEQHAGRSLAKALFRWLPYLLVLTGFSYWRVVLFQAPPDGDRNPPVVLYQFLQTPLTTAVDFLVTALKDTTAIFVTGWYTTLQPGLFDLFSTFNRYALVVVLGAFGSLAVYLSRLRVQEAASEAHATQYNWIKEALVIGMASLVLGILPFWLTDRAILTQKNQFWATRFGLASMFGAALLAATMIEALFESRSRRTAVLSLCLALAIGAHLRNANDFRYSWEKQLRFYQQLSLRAPAIAPGTAIVTESEILPYMGEYPTSFAINTNYQQPGPSGTPYWFFTLYYSFPDIDEFVNGVPLEGQKLSASFNGESRDSLVIAFEPEIQRCLWVLRPEDAELRLISPFLRTASQASALERISASVERAPLPAEIFAAEIRQDWCYYFEKADLARQYQDWDSVAALWETAKAVGHRPENGFEYLPFIEAFAHLENWDQVGVLTRQANRISQGMSPLLCETLKRLMDSTPASGDRETVKADLDEHLSCTP